MTKTKKPKNIDRDALLSDNAMYRYELTRKWDKTKPRVCFIGLNPSTADAFKDDTTCTKCINFANRWGYGSISMINAYAFRATWPEELFKADDPIGPGNDDHIKRVADNCALLVPCWGTLINRVRAAQVFRILESCDADIKCLGLTKDGHPKHPSRLAYATPLEPYAPTKF